MYIVICQVLQQCWWTQALTTCHTLQCYLPPAEDSAPQTHLFFPVSECFCFYFLLHDYGNISEGVSVKMQKCIIGVETLPAVESPKQTMTASLLARFN